MLQINLIKSLLNPKEIDASHKALTTGRWGFSSREHELFKENAGSAFAGLDIIGSVHQQSEPKVHP